MTDIEKVQAVAQADQEKYNKLKLALERMKNKQNKILFCIPDIPTPTASIYEIYFQATVMKQLGYNVVGLIQNHDQVIPAWIESNLTDFKHVNMEKNDLNIGPDDVLVIPDIFTNIMEQTKDLPCIRVGLLQSIDYMVNALIPGMDWSSFGVQKILTTNNNLRGLVEEYYGQNKFEIKVYKIGIPDYFKPSDKPQRPIISIVGRNNNDISKIVKLFYAKFPQFSWVTFDVMLTNSKPPLPMRRIDFANRLKTNFAAVWLDRLASFGTFPLECMKSGVIPICLKPDICPEYIVEKDAEGKIRYVVNSGIWTDDLYSIPIIIGDICTKFLDDSIGIEIYNKMTEIAKRYNVENSKIEIINAYASFLNERQGIFEKAITDFEKLLENNKIETLEENKTEE